MPAVTLTQFTDPLCTWSWGAEPVLRQVEESYRDQIEVAFVTGGLVADFETFHDGANDISEPVDVAPHWAEAAERHGMPVDPDVWREDPPGSSYPASRAYHAAKRQDAAAAKRYLRRTREAVAAERRNVAREDVLVDLARDVGLEPDTFRVDLDSLAVRDAFEVDMEAAHRRGATAFPTFLVERGEDHRLLRGYQSFDAVAAAIEAVAPSVERHEPRPLAAFVAAHDRVATREVAAVYGLDDEAAHERLDAADGVDAQPRGNSHFWTTAN